MAMTRSPPVPSPRGTHALTEGADGLAKPSARRDRRGLDARSGGSVAFGLRNARIGASDAGTLTISNTGSVAATFTLDGAVDQNALTRQLQVRASVSVAGGDERPLYEGPLAGFPALSAGRVEPGQAARFDFGVILPSTGSAAGDNALQGLTAGATFTW